MVKAISVLCMSALMTACALPRPAYEAVDFVSLKDRETVSLTRQGLDYLVRGRTIDGELKLRQALYLEPTARPIRYNLASALVRQGLYEEAQNILIELRKEVPGSSRYASLLASAYLEEENFAEAERILIESLMQGQQDKDIERQVVAMRNLATVAFRKGDEEDALCWSEQAFSLSPDEDQQVKHARLLLAAHYPRKALHVASEAPQRVAKPDAADLSEDDALQNQDQSGTEELPNDSSFFDANLDSMQEGEFGEPVIDTVTGAGTGRRAGRRGPNRKLQIDILKAHAQYELGQFEGAFRLSEKHLAHPNFSAQDQLSLTVVNVLALEQLPKEKKAEEIQRLSQPLEEDAQESTGLFSDDEPMNELKIREQAFVKEMLEKSYLLYWPSSLIDDAERKIMSVQESD